MKKVLLTACAALAMVAMVACNNNAKNAEETETAATEQCDKPCAKKCAHEGDSAACCKAEGAAEGGCCQKAEGEGCQKADGQKCCKGEGKECPNKAN